MHEFNQQFEGLSEAQKQTRYQRLAEACLAHYPAVNGKITFVAHNAGIVYVVEATHGKFLLKIHQAIGEGTGHIYPEFINSGLLWLDAIAHQTNLTIQQPIANQHGEFIATVDFDDLTEPFYCSIQHWLEGQHPHDPSPDQAYQIGVLMARLHEHGSQWIQGKTPRALKYDAIWLEENFRIFAKVKSLAILSEAEWANVEQTYERIQEVMQKSGQESLKPIHGDIHHTNLLIVGGEMCAIDFGALIMGHYGYDLGVTLYHFMYLDAATRQALVNGYQTIRKLSMSSELDLEAFLCAAALVNLAFNVELPDQRTSALFIRNVREFAGIFCEKLIHNTPFALQYYNYVL